MTALCREEKHNDSGAEELHEPHSFIEVEKFRAISYFLLLTMNKRTK